MFNPNPRIERHDFGAGRFCLVVDAALNEPERLVQFAGAQRDAFRAVDFNAYPGSYLLAPDALAQALDDFFRVHIRRCFDARRLEQSHCRLSLVTLAPAQLRPRQWLCHRDGGAAAAPQSIQASVLYLFRDAALGGTSFYAPRVSAIETAQLLHDASTLDAATFSAKYALTPGYMLGSNRYFERIGSVEARWNRLIFYDGQLLHSGDILAPERLSDDPLNGRLTLNGFFTSRRHAALA